MTRDTQATRRFFFRQAGAALSAPLALAASLAPEARGEAREADPTRVAELEDARAIVDLHRRYARVVNAGAYEELSKLFAEPASAQVDVTIRALRAEDFGDRDVVEVAADRSTATARIHCTVDTATPIEPDGTLVEMARQQGEGVLKRSESRVLEHECVRVDGRWRIKRSVFRDA
jgi:acyl-CoA hydrolase